MVSNTFQRFLARLRSSFGMRNPRLRRSKTRTCPQVTRTEALEDRSLLTPTLSHFLTMEHVDLNIGYGGSWSIGPRDSDANPAVEYSAEDALLYAGSPALTERVANPAFDFIGVGPGEEFYLLPATQDVERLYLGLSGYGVSAGLIDRYDPFTESKGRASGNGRWIKVSLVGVSHTNPDGTEGTGQVSMWQSGDTGPTVFMSTYNDAVANPNGSGLDATDGITSDDAMWIIAGGHTHYNFGFTQPGRYEIQLQTSAYFGDNGNNATPNEADFRVSGPMTIYVSVASVGQLEIDSSSNTVNEGDGTASVTVNRVGGSDGRITVNYSLTQGTATADDDYTPVTGTIIFEDGQTTGTINIPILDDLLDESAETFQVTLSVPGPSSINNYLTTFEEDANGLLGSTVSTTITILDNDNPPTISVINDLTINEDTSTGAIPFVVDDIETPAGDLQVTATSSNTTLVPNANIVFSGTGANRTVTVTPAATLSGSTTITITVTDGTGFTATETFDLTVTPIDDLPVANSQTILTDPGTAVAVLLTGSDEETAEIDFILVSQPSHGTLSGTAPNLTYTPDAGFAGFDTFTFQVNDGAQDSTVAIVNIQVGNLGQVEFSSPTFSVNEMAGYRDITVRRVGGSDGRLVVQYASADGTATAAGPDYTATTGVLVFEDGETSRIITIQTANQSTAIVEPNETFTLTLTAPSEYADQDILGTNSTTVITINDSPTISTIAAQTTLIGTATAEIAFTIADTATAAEDLQIEVFSSNPTLIPLSGIVLGGSGGNLTLAATPVAGLSGKSTITIVVTDSEGAMAVRAVEFSVGAAATATAITLPATLPDVVITADESFTLNYKLASSAWVTQVTRSNTDLFNSPGTGSTSDLRTQPNSGGTDRTLRIRGADNSTAAGKYGLSTVTLGFTGAGAPAAQTFNVRVNPRAVADNNLVAIPGTTSTLDVLGNDVIPLAGHTFTITGVSTPANGALQITDDGKFVRYTPTNPDAYFDTFTYTVTVSSSDAFNGYTFTGIGYVKIGGYYVVDSAVASQHTDIAINYVNGEWIQNIHSDASIFGSVQSGTFSPTVVDSDEAVLFFDPSTKQARPASTFYDTLGVPVGADIWVGPTGTNGNKIYLGFNSENTSVNVIDNWMPVGDSRATSNSKWMAIQLVGFSGPGNMALFYAGDVAFDTYDGLNSVDEAASGGNVSDTFWGFAGSHDHPSFVFTAPGRYSFTLQTTTSVGGQLITSPPVTFYADVDTISGAALLGENPPLANADTANAVENAGPVTINVLGNDSSSPDPDEVITVTAVTQGSHGGTVAIAPNGTVTYTPAADFFGEESFTYTITDEHGGSATSTVTITVLANDAPTAVDDVYVVSANNSVRGNVLFNDSDLDGDAFTAALENDPQHGEVVMAADGSFAYTPNGAFAGSDSFTYTVTDAFGATSAATVTVTAAGFHDFDAIVGVGHSDIGIAYEEEAWDLHVHADDLGEEYAPQEALYYVAPAALSSRPAGAEFDFIGVAAGEDYYRLPQTQNPELLYLGFGAEELDDGTFEGGILRVFLHGVNGPGQLSVWESSDTGPIVKFSTANGVTGDDFLEILEGGHSHFNWAFTAAGRYEVMLEVVGTLTGESSPTSATATYYFSVDNLGRFQFETSSDSIGEGESKTITVQRVGGSDGSLTVDFSTAGSAIEGVDYQALTSLTFADGETEKTFTVVASPDSEIEGDETISISLVAPADSFTEIGTPDTFELTLLDDTYPALSDFADRFMLENTTTAAITFTVSDSQTAAGDLVVTTSSSNPALVPHANIVLSGSSANRALTITPAANQIGSTTITVTVTDGGGLQTSETFLLTVTANRLVPFALPEYDGGTFASNAWGQASGDFNGDGNIDLITAGTVTNALAYLPGNGDGTFQPEQLLNAGLGLYTEAIVAVDYDGDSDLDLLAYELNQVTSDGLANEGTITLYRNNGAGQFTREVVKTGLMAGYWLAAGDLNGDGLADVAYSAYQYDLLNNLFVSEQAFALQQPGGQLGASTPLTNAYGDVLIDDVDGDGHLDIVTSGLVVTLPATTAYELKVFAGNGDGTFDAPQSIATGTSPEIQQVIDLNGDGRQDLLVYDRVTGSHLGYYPQQADGSFGARVALLPGYQFALHTVAADINHDGLPDIVSYSYINSAYRLSWAPGLGGGAFGVPILITQNAGGSGLHVLDLDNDSHLDIVSVGSITDTRTGTVGVFLNKTGENPMALITPAARTRVAGDPLEQSVYFGFPITVTGTPRIALEIGGNTVYANYVSGSGTPTLTFRYTVTASDLDLDGVQLASNIIDLNGGTLTDPIGGPGVLEFPNLPFNGVIVNGRGPLVQMISRIDPAASTEGTVRFTVQFAEDVTGVEASDFSVRMNAGDLAGAVVTGVTGSGGLYEVTVSTGTGSGTLGLSVNDSASIFDLSGDVLGRGYTGGEVYTVRKSPIDTIDTYYVEGHADYRPVYNNGEFSYVWHGDTQVLPSDEVITYLDSTAIVNRPAGANYDFLGIGAGQPYYLSNSNGNIATVPFLGWSGESLVANDFADYRPSDPRITSATLREYVKVQMVGFRSDSGGHFSLYSGTTPTVWMATNDGIDSNDSFYLYRTHFHRNTAFSQPGTYEIDVVISGYLDGNANNALDASDVYVESGIVTMVFHVDTLGARDDLYGVNPQGVLNGNVTQNDIWHSGIGESIATIETAPTKGTLALQPDGSFTYSPSLAFDGTDSFAYRLTNPRGGFTTATVTIVDGSPTISVIDDVTLDEDTASGAISFTIDDLESAAENLTVSGSSSNPTLVPLSGIALSGTGANRTITITPVASQFGTADITLTVLDEMGLSTMMTFRVTVAPVNDAPDALDDVFTVSSQANSIWGNVLFNDSDIEGDALTAVLVNGPTKGSVTLNADGSFAYTPGASFNGTDSFTYRAGDGSLFSTETTVTINLTGDQQFEGVVSTGHVDIGVAYEDGWDLHVHDEENDVEYEPYDALLHVGPAAITTRDGGLAGSEYDFLGVAVGQKLYRLSQTENPELIYLGFGTEEIDDDTFLGGQVQLRLKAVNGPGNFSAWQSTDTGPVVAMATSDGITAADFVVLLEGGHEHYNFAFTARGNYDVTFEAFATLADGTVTSSVDVTYRFVANSAADVADDAYSVDEDTPLIVGGPGVLGNDVDPDGDSLVSALVQGPAHGTVTLNADGSFTYVPNANFSGTDTFTYTTTDVRYRIVPLGTLGGNNSFALDVNNNRQVSGNSSITAGSSNPLQAYLWQNGEFIGLGVLPGTGTNNFSRGYAINDSGVVVGESDNNTSFAFVYENGVISGLTRLAGDNFRGVSNDINSAGSIVGSSSNGTTTRPTVWTYNGTTYVAADLGTIAGTTTSTGRAWAINDAGDIVGLSVNEDGTSQATLWSGGTVTNLTSLGDGARFSQAYGINGLGQIVGSSSTGQTVGQLIGTTSSTGITRAFIWENDTIQELLPYNFYAPGNTGLTTNYHSAAMDINDAGVVVGNSQRISGSPDRATIWIDGAALDLNTLIPVGSGWTLRSAEGINQSGDIIGYGSFGGFTRAFLLVPEVTSLDGRLVSNTATVTITVNPTSDAPVATDDSYEVGTGSSVYGNVLFNDSDPDGDAVSVTSSTAAAKGTVVLQTNGSFVYTPGVGFDGTDSFTYTISDGLGGTDTATVTISLATLPDFEVVLSEGHADLGIFAGSEDTIIDHGDHTHVIEGEFGWDLHVHDHETEAEYHPDEALLFVGSQGVTVRPAGTEFDFIGVTAGETYYRLPQVQNPELLFLGIGTEEIEPGTFLGGTVTLRLKNASGPGHFSMWQTTDDGPVVAMSTWDGVTEGDFLVALEHGHSHFNYGFTAIGHYAVTVEAFGTLPNGEVVSSGDVTYYFAVNAPPVATADEYAVGRSGVLTGNVLENDLDADGHELAVSLITGPTSGILDLQSDGTFTYTPGPDFTGGSFTYSVLDGFGGTHTATVVITQVNEAPTGLVLTNVITTLPENTSTTIAIKLADIAITDDGLGTNVLSLSGVDATFFEIVGNELRLKAGTVLNFEGHSSYQVTLRVDDAGVGATPDATLDYTLTISDVNEPPTGLLLQNVVSTLSETTSTTSAITLADIVITDDALGTNVLSLAGPDAAFFEIVGKELRLRAGTALNFESKSTYQVTVSVDDSTVGTTPDATLDYMLTISDVNEPPTALTLQNAVGTLPESTSTTNAVKLADIVITDDALGTNVLSLTGTDAAFFEIVGGALRLKAGTALDFEGQGSYQVTLRVDDAGVGATPDATLDYTLTISDVNEAPSLSLQNAMTSLPENTSTATAIKLADIVTTDDALGTNVLSLTGADAAFFEIVGGELRLKAGTMLNFESKSTYQVTVSVDDAAVGTAPDNSLTYSLTVENVNEPPQLPASVILSVFENSFANTLVGTVTGTDPDAGDSLSYTITNGNTAGAFEINPNTGVIRVLNPAALDFETQPVFTLTVEATDQQDLKATSTVTVNVANLNEAPTLGSTAETISESAANGTLVGQALGSDPDANDTLAYAIIGGNAGNLFQINPTTGEITVANSVGLDFETQPTITLTIEVRDADGLTSTATAVIELTDANEAPQLALNGEPVAYGKKTNKKTGPVTILPSVTMTDPDLSPAFRIGGGTLTVSIDLAGKQTKKEFKAYDTVSGITNLTSIGSLISSQQVDGREVTVIQLNSTATAVDVQNWLRSLRFSTKGKGLKQTTRQLTVQATDNGGLTSNLLQQTIHVSNE